MRTRNPAASARWLLLSVVLIWGATFTLVKAALADASPLLFNLLRMTLAAVVLAAIHRAELRQMSRRDLLRASIVGVFLAGGYQFQTLGLARTTPAKSALITGFVVVLVPLLTSIPSLRPLGAHRPGVVVACSALASFAGLVLLTTPPGVSPGRFAVGIESGDLFTLLCAVFFAGHLLSIAHFAPDLAAGPLATVQIAVAAGVMALTLPLGGQLHLELTGRLLAALAITGLLATAFAFTVQSWAQQHLPPVQTAILLTLEPVFALLVSALFYGERMSGRALLGGLLILGASFLLEIASGRGTHLPEVPA